MSFPEMHHNLIKLEELKKQFFSCLRPGTRGKNKYNHGQDTNKEQFRYETEQLLLLDHVTASCLFDFQSWRPIRWFKESLSINSPFPGIMDHSLQNSSGFFDVSSEKSHQPSDRWFRAMSKLLECDMR
jgi:hypothetical protein